MPRIDPAEPRMHSQPSSANAFPATPDDDLLPAVQAALLQQVSDLIEIQAGLLDIESELGEYGFDSIGLTTLTYHLNQLYGLELMPTLFFEYPSLSGLARYLVDNHREVFAAR